MFEPKTFVRLLPDGGVWLAERARCKPVQTRANGFTIRVGAKLVSPSALCCLKFNISGAAAAAVTDFMCGMYSHRDCPRIQHAAVTI